MSQYQLNPTPVRFPREIVSQIQLEAARRGVTKNKLVVIAVRQLLEQIESDQLAA